MDSKQFFAAVADKAALSREEAADLTRASLAVLADRISAGEARDLAMHVPQPLDELLRGTKTPAGHFGVDEFLERVAKHTGLNADETKRGVAAVFATLREVVPADAYTQAMGQLPGEIRDLA